MRLGERRSTAAAAFPARRRRAISLAECVIAVALVGLMLTTALNSSTASRNAMNNAADVQRATLLANDLLDEILRCAYEDETGGGSLGVNSGENATQRWTFDDVDDYHGWTSTPPRRRDGTSMTQYAGWTRAVIVQWVSAGAPNIGLVSESGVKRITVSVSRNGLLLAEVRALRARGLGDARSCCLASGKCARLPADVCTYWGGTPGGPNTRCWSAGCIGKFPVAAWLFDEPASPTTPDSSGNNHTGTLNGPTRLSGRIGNALKFDGTNDEVTVAHTSKLSIPLDLSIVAWVRPDSINGRQVLLFKGSSTNDSNYWLGIDGSNVVFGFFDRSTTTLINLLGILTVVTKSPEPVEFKTTHNPLSNGQWTHVAATIDTDAKRVRIYINGSLTNTFNTSALPNPNSAIFRLGRSPTNNFFNGVLDETAIFARAITAEEVNQFAGSGLMSLLEKP